ncbi:MAG TPA: hypothetical protein VMZ04_05695 [Anaerolineae bacterium]|nr:hypothetical protein [Anaerolineae bacterium]
MRIDEFSNAANIDGTILSAERTRFMLVGFDLTLIIDTDASRVFTPVFENRVFTPVFENRTRTILGG